MTLDAKQILSKADSVLEKIIATIPEPRIESTRDVFLDIISCVLEQQIHYRSSKKTFLKMLDKAEMTTLTPETFFQFSERAFSSVKLSVNKYETALRVVEFWQTHQVDWQSLSNDDVRKTLRSIKGIGNWTVDMILLYTLERSDVFPSDDFHLKQIMTKLYNLNPRSKLASQMIEVSTRWGGYSSLATKYLLSWKEFVNKTRTNQ